MTVAEKQAMALREANKKLGGIESEMIVTWTWT